MYVHPELHHPMEGLLEWEGPLTLNSHVGSCARGLGLPFGGGNVRRQKQKPRGLRELPFVTLKINTFENSEAYEPLDSKDSQAAVAWKEEAQST